MKEKTEQNGMFSGMVVFFVTKGVQARRLQVFFSKPIFYLSFSVSKFVALFKFLSFCVFVRFGSRGWCRWVV